MAKRRKQEVPASVTVERDAARWSRQLEQIQQAMDPFGIAASFRRAAEGWLANPDELAGTLSKLTRDVQALQLNAWQTATGLRPEPVQVPKPDDERFSDPVWNESAPFSLLKQYYLLYTHWLEEALFDAPDTPAMRHSGRASGSMPLRPTIISIPTRSR
jgi:polyhydroxyalkanoate synthase